MMSYLSKSIIATLSYYDIFDYPLTSFEIFKYLIKPKHGTIPPVSYKDVLLELKGNEELQGLINNNSGFYFLKNREIICDIRSSRKQLAIIRWEKFKFILKLIAKIPFISSIFISGSYSMGNIREESDVDLLIATKNGRIWTGRFFVSFFLYILGQKRHGEKTAGRFCLNHFVTDNKINIDLPSIYNAETYISFIPVYGDFLFYENNEWINKFVFNTPADKEFNIYSLQVAQKKINKKIKRIFEYMLSGIWGNILEKFLKFLQMQYIKLHSVKNREKGRVVLSDNVLEFHPNSPEAKIIDIFNKRMYDLKLDEFGGQEDSGLV